MTEPTPPEQDLLAAELALGLLDGTERAEALRLCLSDPAFARAVDAWSIRLSPLLVFALTSASIRVRPPYTGATD